MQKTSLIVLVHDVIIRMASSKHYLTSFLDEQFIYNGEFTNFLKSQDNEAQIRD